MPARRAFAIALLLIAAPWLVARADAPRYDGTLDAFRDFVAAHHKDWPVPEALGFFPAPDGKPLRYAHWLPQDPGAVAGTVVFFQGRTEFIEKNIYTYKDLRARGYDVWTLDWRGQGLSFRPLAGTDKGHIDRFDTYVADAKRFVDEVVKPAGRPRPHILLAHSMGGGIGALYLERYPDDFRKAVFTSPLIRLPEAKTPWYLRPGNWLKTVVGRHGEDCIYSLICTWESDFGDGFDSCARGAEAREGDLAHPEVASRYSHDPVKLAEIDCWIRSSRVGSASGPNLGLASGTSGWLRAAFRGTDAIMASRDALKTPLLIVGAGGESDPNRAVVSNPGQRAFCAALPDRCCRLEIPGAGHEILIENGKYRDPFFRLFEEFVKLDPPDPKAFCASHPEFRG